MTGKTKKALETENATEIKIKDVTEIKNATITKIKDVTTTEIKNVTVTKTKEGISRDGRGLLVTTNTETTDGSLLVDNIATAN